MESEDLTSTILDDAGSIPERFEVANMTEEKEEPQPSESQKKTVKFEEPTGNIEMEEVSLFWDIVEGVKSREVRGIKSAGRGAYYAAVLVAAFIVFIVLIVFIPALIITIQTTLSPYTLFKIGIFIFSVGTLGTLFGWFYSLRVNKKRKKTE